MKNKFHLNNPVDSVEMPVYGQIGLPVHMGFKAFDFRRRVVLKFFNKNVDTSVIRKQIDKIKDASKFDFTPSLRNWNIFERWYEEDYLIGSTYKYESIDSKKSANKFYEDIGLCLEKLIFSRPPIIKNSVEHALQIVKLLECEISKNSNLNPENSMKIMGFVNSIVKLVQSEGNNSVYLVFTHGDMVPANILNTKNGVKILDWESTNYRSALFDFYSYFYVQSVHYMAPIDKISSEVTLALANFISELSKKAPDISKNLLTLDNVYRWLYYIERIYMLCKRQKSDTNLNISNIILKFIETFKEYEKYP